MNDTFHKDIHQNTILAVTDEVTQVCDFCFESQNVFIDLVLSAAQFCDFFLHCEHAAFFCHARAICLFESFQFFCERSLFFV